MTALQLQLHNRYKIIFIILDSGTLIKEQFSFGKIKSETNKGSNNLHLHFYGTIDYQVTIHSTINMMYI